MDKALLAKMLATKALGANKSEEGEVDDDTSLQDASREIWDALKNDDYDGFAEALGNYQEIKNTEK